MRRQLRAQRRGLQGPLALDEQRRSDPRLQHGQRPAYGRLRQAQPLRTRADTARIQYGGKLHEMCFAQFHNVMV